MALDASLGGHECAACGSEGLSLNKHPTTHTHMLCGAEHVGGHFRDFIISPVHGIVVIPAAFGAIPNKCGASLRIHFDEGLHCAAEPSACWHVLHSFLFQEEVPKKASRECGFIFEEDWPVVVDLVRWGFRELQEVEAHHFFHLGDFDAKCLFCHTVHEVLCQKSIFGAHPMWAMGEDLMHGVLFNGETHLFTGCIPKVVLTHGNNSMFTLMGFVW